ncbi:MAG TPA: 50S ribosomal protein L19 [Candidatus Pacearchaeota archaeon]|nr:50S ribosomal protein L19 [Candidatus Parcubacteria bacterium]HNP79535.1 50S ribosomal protein L19 [Candidatus Pacearchaeota archaeon]HOC53659.1 50S ribosomal protein L19 [Candidatus Pacearchaeota archaeon]HQM24755.1 50S ribosomal protein L19 [Candidatus Pacearchaeota archaeon]
MAEEANTETVETVVSKEETKGIKESFLKQGIPEFKQGDTVKVYQKIKEKNKERIQIFEGQILAVKHGRGLNGTITVRKVIQGIGVEKIIPIHSPAIDKIEVIKKSKTRRSKLYYLRKAKGRKARLKIEEEAKVEEGE